MQTDEDEHSIELHLPYVRKVFGATNGGMLGPPCDSSPSNAMYSLPLSPTHMRTLLTILLDMIDPDADIKIVPILVGGINEDQEREYGELLAPYFAREDTFVIVSSDFCHW